MNEPAVAAKVCSRCKTRKPLKDFYRDASKADGCDAYCKDCRRAYGAAWHAANRERANACSRRYNRMHPEIARRYYQTERGKRVGAQTNRRYCRTEKGRRTMIRARHNRRARLVAGDTDVTEEGMLRLLAAYEFCPYCGSVFEDGGGQVWDHIIPLSKGGLHRLDNLLPVCAKCNASKGSKLLEEWETVRLRDAKVLA